MPKQKTNRSAAKRFRRTATGKLKRNHAFARHILTKKGRKRKRQLRRGTMTTAADAGRVRAMMPYAAARS